MIKEYLKNVFIRIRQCTIAQLVTNLDRHSPHYKIYKKSNKMSFSVMN